MSNSVIGRIYDIYHSLTAGERRVADFILEDPTRLPHMTTLELRAAIGVSEPTIFRFCKAMGYRGLQDFRIQLAFVTGEGRESKRATKDAKTDPQSARRDFARSALLAMQQVAARTEHLLDYAELELLADKMLEAHRITFFGVGSSYLVCLDAKRKLQRLDLDVRAGNCMSDTLSEINRMKSGDILVVVSHSGTTLDAQQVIRVGAMHGLETVLLTSYPESACARHAQHVIKTYAPEASHSRSGIASRISQFAVFDALYMLMIYQKDPVLLQAIQAQNDCDAGKSRKEK